LIGGGLKSKYLPNTSCLLQDILHAHAPKITQKISGRDFGATIHGARFTIALKQIRLGRFTISRGFNNTFEIKPLHLLHSLPLLNFKQRFESAWGRSI
jgi:hypothetical protein